jgi:hypothetical protein
MKVHIIVIMPIFTKDSAPMLKDRIVNHNIIPPVKSNLRPKGNPTNFIARARTGNTVVT